MLRSLSSYIGTHLCGSKSKFFKEGLMYLGFVVPMDVLCMDEGKVKGIFEWPTPHNVANFEYFS
jgi:hypothetical protein